MFDHLPYSACHANSVEPFSSFSYEQTTVQNLVRNTWTQIKFFLVIASILGPWGAWSTRTTWKPNKMDYYNRMLHIFHEVAKMDNCCPIGPQISTPNLAMEVEKGKTEYQRVAPGQFRERVDETSSPSMLWTYPKIILCVCGNDPFKNDHMVKQNLKFRRDNVLWNIASVHCKFNGAKQAFVRHFVKATFSAFVHTLHRHCSGVTSSLAEL